MRKFAALVITAILAGLFGTADAQITATRPGTRAVTSGSSDAATYADFLGTIAWRSSFAGPKTEVLPTCGPYNNGSWIQIVDADGTAATYPITISAESGTVRGPDNPVKITLSRGAFVLTCDGAAASWVVTATATPQGPVISFVLRNGGGHVSRNGGGSVERNAP